MNKRFGHREVDGGRRLTRLLVLLVLPFSLIFLRCFLLTTVFRDDEIRRARAPSHKLLLTRPERGEIFDRFGVPLAVNEPTFNASILYAPIRQLPSSVKGEEGKRTSVRATYIHELARLLGGELAMDPREIEDLIHGRAALFPHMPIPIKEGISEEQYFRLKMLGLDYPGVFPERSSRRIYPQGKTACHVIGYLGSVQGGETVALKAEIRQLQNFLLKRDRGELIPLPQGYETPEGVRTHLALLEEKALRLDELCGREGVEKEFDELLRGKTGRRFVEIDAVGRILCQLPSERQEEAGKDLTLALSAELQSYAEEILESSEKWRKRKDGLMDGGPLGGAIIAVIPNTGEVVCFASTPRFDPNDFVAKNETIGQWLESESYIADFWEGRSPFGSERLSWERYLNAILGKTSLSRRTMAEIQTLGQAFEVEELFRESEDHDKLLIADLLRLLLPKEILSEELYNALLSERLTDLFSYMQTAATALHEMRPICEALFHATEMRTWREHHFTAYLKERRREEREQHLPARPYPEYLRRVERRAFAGFWKTYAPHLLGALLLEQWDGPDYIYKRLQPYLASMKQLQRERDPKFLARLEALPHDLRTEFLGQLRPMNKLDRPLLGRYRNLRGYPKEQRESHLASAFYPLHGYGYLRSRAFREACPQGSVFKVLVAYEAMRQKFLKLPEDRRLPHLLNPLTVTDNATGSGKNEILGMSERGETYTRLYKGGRLPKSHPNIGKIDVIGALEQSSNLYFALLAVDHLQNPTDLVDAASLFGFGERSGIALPYEVSGILPNDLQTNLTGLYSFAIGHHTLVVTPLQDAMFMAAIANGGNLLVPKLVKSVQGIARKTQPPFLDEMKRLGFSSSLFLAPTSSEITFPSGPELRRTLFLPPEIRSKLIEGMARVIQGPRGTARPSVIARLREDAALHRTFMELHNQLIGKTGTADILFKQTLDAETPAKMVAHLFFAGISLQPDTKSPELAIVVYLPMTAGGAQGAVPYAALIMKKYRELCAKHYRDNHSSKH